MLRELLYRLSVLSGHRTDFFFTPGKKDVHIRVLVGFLRPDGLNSMNGKPPAGSAIRVIVWGAFRPNFGNQNDIRPYSPREQKPADFHGFLGDHEIQKGESGPVLGVFSLEVS
jgi:hypothetical protein